MPEPRLGDSSAPVNWALASVLGTGWYKLGDGRDAFIVYAPFRQTLRETDPNGRGLDAAGWYINWAGSLGLYQLDLDPGIIDPGNIGTISFTPGVEMEIPMSDRWALRPYAHFGRGVSLGDGPETWIYYGGVKSRYWLDQEQHWSWLNGLGYAGYNPDGAPAGGLLVLYSGVEYEQALQQGDDDSLALFWQAGYRAINDSSDFGLFGETATLQGIDDTIELGLAIGPREGTFQWGFLSLERLGLVWNFEPGGEFASVTLEFSSWFMQ